MQLNLDSHMLTIPCPKCGKQLQEQFGRIKRDKHITCDTCGRISADTDQIREVENRLNKELADQVAKLSKTIINIKF